MHPHSERIPPFCVVSSVKMYTFYGFMDIYRFSASFPAQWFCLLRSYKHTRYFSTVFVQPGEAVWGQDTAGCDPQDPSKGRAGGSMAEGPRSGTALLAAPGSSYRLAQHFQHPVLLLQQQSCKFRQGSSSSRRCYFQKKTPQPQASNICSGLSCLAQPRRLSPGRSCCSSRMVPLGSK